MLFFTQDQEKKTATNFTSSYSDILLKDGVQVLCLWAQYQSRSSGHCIGNSSLLERPCSQIMERTAIFHPRPRTGYKLYTLLLINDNKGWCCCSRVLVFIGMLSQVGQFLSYIARQSYMISRNSNEMVTTRCDFG